MHTRSWPTSLITTSLALGLAAPAQAGTIELRPHIDHGNDVRESVFTAAPGEVNQVTVEPVGRGFRLTDAGAPVTGVCPEGICPDPYRLLVQLGDGDDGPVPVADLADGGAGRDTVDYGGRATPVRVELALDRGPEGDVLTSIEHANGGDGDDVLIGDERPNSLNGNGGDDRLEGRGGADWLEDGGGRNDLRGGAGDDRIELSGPAEVRCGPGLDRVGRVESVTRLHADCERVAGGGPLLRFGPRTVTARWDQRLYPQDCGLRVTLDGARIKLGRPVRLRRPATLRFDVRRDCSTAYGETVADQAFRLVP